jgi:hypothetical protein
MGGEGEEFCFVPQAEYDLVLLVACIFSEACKEADNNHGPAR